MVEGLQDKFYSEENRAVVILFNNLIKLGQLSGLKLMKLDRDIILNYAKKKTGFEDFGNEKYIEVLDKLIDNVHKLEMTPFGEFFLNIALRKITMNRLYIHDFLKKHPEIKDIPIKKPLFIVGFPRTGTTLLQNVLSSGPGYRALYLWELATPYPLHDDRNKDKKIRMSKIDLPLNLLKLGVPNMSNIHDVRADTKEECWILLGNSLCITHSDTGTGLSDWNNWLMSSDRRWAYEEYKRLLQIQAYITPTEQFVLKCPTHLWNLKPIMEVFPDARIVWIHRNPIKCIASTSSLVKVARNFFYGHIDQKHAGKIVEDRFHLIIKDAMGFRKNINQKQIYDLNYETLIKDIPKAVKDVRMYFGFPHNKEHYEAVLEFLNRLRRDKPGKHRYSIEQFGLDPEEIVIKFRNYIEKFNIKIS